MRAGSLYPVPKRPSSARSASSDPSNPQSKQNLLRHLSPPRRRRLLEIGPLRLTALRSPLVLKGNLNRAQFLASATKFSRFSAKAEWEPFTRRGTRNWIAWLPSKSFVLN